MIELVRQLGFLLLGGLFVWAGAVHFATFKDVAAMIAERGFPAPAFLLTAGSIVELVGGLCRHTRHWPPLRRSRAHRLFDHGEPDDARLLARYSGVERLGLRSAFITNIAIIGGLLLAGTTGGE